jgi:hypothetical protein
MLKVLKPLGAIMKTHFVGASVSHSVSHTHQPSKSPGTLIQKMNRYRYHALPFCFMFVIMLMQSQPSQMFVQFQGSNQTPDCDGNAAVLTCIPLNSDVTCENAVKWSASETERFYTRIAQGENNYLSYYCHRLPGNSRYCFGAGYDLTDNCKIN